MLCEHGYWPKSVWISTELFHRWCDAIEGVPHESALGQKGGQSRISRHNGLPQAGTRLVLMGRAFFFGRVVRLLLVVLSTDWRFGPEW